MAHPQPGVLICFVFKLAQFQFSLRKRWLASTSIMHLSKDSGGGPRFHSSTAASARARRWQVSTCVCGTVAYRPCADAGFSCRCGCCSLVLELEKRRASIRCVLCRARRACLRTPSSPLRTLRTPNGTVSQLLRMRAAVACLLLCTSWHVRQFAALQGIFQHLSLCRLRAQRQSVPWGMYGFGSFSMNLGALLCPHEGLCVCAGMQACWRQRWSMCRM